jgi:cell division protease FtsH
MKEIGMDEILKVVERTEEVLKMAEKEKAQSQLETLANESDFKAAIEAVSEFMATQNELFSLVRKLKRLLPKEKEKITPNHLTTIFLGGHVMSDLFDTTTTLGPPNIALIVLNDLFSNKERFTMVDPNQLQEAADLIVPYTKEKVSHTTIDIANTTHTVPMGAEHWLYDNKLGARFVVTYSPTRSGSIGVNVTGGFANREAIIQFTKELNNAILESPYLRGQILEVEGGSDFRIVNLKNTQMPVIDEKLKSELDKNIVNLFKKEDEFKKYNLPIKRAIILEGPPGCGKTLLARYLANSVKGAVTTIWVTSKSISHASDVAAVFDVARKLSPSLVVMEDLDLISGTRESLILGGGNALGEMLNQLDGLTPNDSLVLVASTNRVASLDEALNDRPGRFDRIYKLDKPTPELAKQIAKDYLLKRGVSAEEVNALQLNALNSGDYTGAQVVEIIKGAIFEAIHRGCPINDLCINRSRDGLEEQRKLIK